MPHTGGARDVPADGRRVVVPERIPANARSTPCPTAPPRRWPAAQAVRGLHFTVADYPRERRERQVPAPCPVDQLGLSHGHGEQPDTAQAQVGPSTHTRAAARDGRRSAGTSRPWSQRILSCSFCLDRGISSGRSDFPANPIVTASVPFRSSSAAIPAQRSTTTARPRGTSDGHSRTGARSAHHRNVHGRQ
jgi:hypothetical protein